jgi:hypothetical protein
LGFAIFYHLLIDEMCYISTTRQHWKPKREFKFKDDDGTLLHSKVNTQSLITIRNASRILTHV